MLIPLYIIAVSLITIVFELDRLIDEMKMPNRVEISHEPVINQQLLHQELAKQTEEAKAVIVDPDSPEYQIAMAKREHDEKLATLNPKR